MMRSRNCPLSFFNWLSKPSHRYRVTTGAGSRGTTGSSYSARVTTGGVRPGHRVTSGAGTMPRFPLLRWTRRSSQRQSISQDSATGTGSGSNHRSYPPRRSNAAQPWRFWNPFAELVNLFVGLIMVFAFLDKVLKFFEIFSVLPKPRSGIGSTNGGLEEEVKEPKSSQISTAKPQHPVVIRKIKRKYFGTGYQDSSTCPLLCPEYLDNHCLTFICPMVHSKQPYQWQHLHLGMWFNFCSQSNKDIEASFAQPDQEAHEISPQAPERKCRLEFNTMTVIWNGEEKANRIRRLVMPETHRLATRWLWSWQDTLGKWHTFGQTNGNVPECKSQISSTEIEAHYQTNSMFPLTLLIGTTYHKINFNSMTQKSVVSGESGPVRRRPKFMQPSEYA